MQGIVHRDVKPGNFLFSTKANKGYLIDFNLALVSRVFNLVEIFLPAMLLTMDNLITLFPICCIGSAPEIWNIRYFLFVLINVLSLIDVLCFSVSNYDFKSL